MLLVTLYALLAAALAVHASSVVVEYPLDDQLPPIARTNAPYTWTFHPDTFLSDPGAALSYSVSALPAWLAFDPSTRTFSGTPSASDEGTPRVVVKASDPKSSDSASSGVDFCVTPYPAPELHIPPAQQFDADNPSLSSVFLVSSSSSLYGTRPALRVPPKWSFSIGFDYGTFVAKNNLYYAARQLNGSPLPGWIAFNERVMTFNGVTPNITGPYVLSLALHASDQQGYSASSVDFDLIVAPHDLSLAKSALPTVNITADQPFSFSLGSADFSGVLLDGQQVESRNITSLTIDTSQLGGWLKYDPASKTLSGQSPSDFEKGVLPVSLTSSFNQTLHTNITLTVVPSFFSSDNLDSILATSGSSIDFNLAQFYSNTTGLGNDSDVDVTASFDPLESGDFLSFDTGSAHLSGAIPDQLSYEHVVVTFTAYSRLTHSTSHTTLPLSLSTADFENQHDKSSGNGLSSAARSKLLLGLKIAFGIICGFVNIAILFAVLRRCTRVPDSAEVGEEAQRAWTAEEKRWYGIGIEVNGQKYEPPHSARWSEGIVSPTRSPSSHQDDGVVSTLTRVLTRTLSNVSRNRSPLSPVGHPQSPPVMKKVEFLGKVRATARVVSDKYRRVVSGPKRPVIGKPKLILTTDMDVRPDVDGLPFTNTEGLLSTRDLPPSDDAATSQYAHSGLTSLIDSPSSSTDGRSIPRRRADFAPPKVITTPPPPVHISENRSLESLADSLATNSSSRTHEAEAVVQRATRATSVRSGYSFYPDESPRPVFEMARPRLVPFTNAARVPVPKLPSSFFSPDPNTDVGIPKPAQATTKRVVSQMAKVFRGSQVPSLPPQPALESADELRTGIEYVRALGGDGRNSLHVPDADRSPASSAMSFSSLESSHQGHADVSTRRPHIPLPAPRMLARTGERFKFRIPVTTAGPSPAPSPNPNSPSAATAHANKRMSKSMAAHNLEARLVSGRPLPKFFNATFDGGAGKSGAGVGVELWGVPVRADTGEYEVGVYDGAECVGRIVVEVVERKAR
ncbi:hypothetical protein C8Q80DRAFT_1198157 [Daedaleopsis nitida]|nr:hypothetical protein C8Q80DRAFT_1198157 [Daedaleopsis nitida]